MAQFLSLSLCLATRSLAVCHNPASFAPSAIIEFTLNRVWKKTWLQTDWEFILGQRSTMDLSSFTQSPLLCVKYLGPYTERNYSGVIHKKNMTKTPTKPYLGGSHNTLLHTDLIT